MTKYLPVQNIVKIVLCLTLPLFIASCSIGKSGTTPSANDSKARPPELDLGFSLFDDDGTNANDLIQDKIENIADDLVERLEEKNTAPSNFRTIMASFVNLDNFDSTSQFGRLISEELMTALNSRGFNVIEVRVGKDLIIEKAKGEFLLSRKVKELTTRYNANSFVVGTYSVLQGKTVFLNTRLIRAADMEVFAAASEYISLIEYPLFKRMLRDVAIEKSNSRWHGVEHK